MIPDPSSPALTQALACARLAKLAYGPVGRIYGDVVPIAVGDDHGFVLRDTANGRAVIAIAGTDSIMQWWGNLNQNWTTVAARFSVQTDQALESMLGDWGLKLKLWITGHSRGGSIAQHLTRLYAKWNPTCTTFGTPRSCKDNDELPNAVSYCLPWDPVPMLPVHSKGYRDPAIRKYLLDGYVDDEDRWALARAIWNAISVGAIYAWEWRHLRWGTDNVAEWGLKRHMMDRYLARLEQLAA